MAEQFILPFLTIAIDGSKADGLENHFDLSGVLLAADSLRSNKLEQLLS